MHMPTSEPPFQPGDIVVVPFPYSDRFAEKRRPALVVSGAQVQAQGLIWLAMITSAKQSAFAFDHPIRALAETGLAAASIVRPLKLACIEPSRIVRRAGQLNTREATEIFAVLHTLIGFSQPQTKRL